MQAERDYKNFDQNCKLTEKASIILSNRKNEISIECIMGSNLEVEHHNLKKYRTDIIVNDSQNKKYSVFSVIQTRKGVRISEIKTSINDNNTITFKLQALAIA